MDPQQCRYELSVNQQQLDVKMKELLEQRERLVAVTGTLTEKVIFPRMEELQRHFDNAKFEDLKY